MDQVGLPGNAEQIIPVEAGAELGEVKTEPKEPTKEVFVDVAPASPTTVPASDVPVAAPVQPDAPEAEPNAAQAVLDDTLGSASDDQYIDRVKKIIAEDKDDPYKEEEDSETLQKEYLTNRFDTKIQKDGK